MSSGVVVFLNVLLQFLEEPRQGASLVLQGACEGQVRLVGGVLDAEELVSHLQAHQAVRLLGQATGGSLLLSLDEITNFQEQWDLAAVQHPSLGRQVQGLVDPPMLCRTLEGHQVRLPSPPRPNPPGSLPTQVQ